MGAQGNSVGERAAGFVKSDEPHRASVLSVNVCSSCLREAKLWGGECPQDVQPPQVRDRRPSCRGMLSGRAKHSPGASICIALSHRTEMKV